MRVLAVSNIPFPYIVELFNELGKHCELSVIFLRRHSRDRDQSWISNDIKNFRPIYLKGIEFSSENVFSLSIIKHLNKKQYDTIYFDCYSRATSILGILFLKLTNTPFIISADGGFIKEKENFVLKKVKHFLISSASYWLSSGQQTNRYLVHYGADVSRIFQFPFTSVLQNDILAKPLTQSEKKVLRQKIGVKNESDRERIMILSIGQFIPRKGFETLIKAAKHLPEICDIYILGGKSSAVYQDLVKELSINNIHFMGFKPKDELIDYYRSADLFVFPTNYDIWGLVINEAMAAGLPVITTNKCIAGLELLDNTQNEYIVPEGDPETLSRKIIRLLKNQKEMEETGYTNLEKIREYSIEKMASKIFTALKKGSVNRIV